MQPLSGPGVPSARENLSATGKNPTSDDQPLTPAQRTALEKLIVKIMALSPSKSAEIWATLRHELGASSHGELLARHFQPAEQLLQNRLATAQQSQGSRQLIQQLTELLPQGNNRQAVSDFIRQQFGHSALSQLSPQQLQQVLNLLQSGSLPLHHPQQNTTSERPLLPMEHQQLQQQVSKLSAATGETPAKIWQTLFDLVGIKTNEPLPARHFQLLNQFLQVKTALSPQATPTLHHLLTVLKQPADQQEQQQLTDYCQTRFNSTPGTPLTHAQLHEVIQQLFTLRLEKAGHVPAPHHENRQPHPLFNPLLAILPASLQATLSKPLVLAAVVAVLALLLIGLF